MIVAFFSDTLARFNQSIKVHGPYVFLALNGKFPGEKGGLDNNLGRMQDSIRDSLKSLSISDRNNCFPRLLFLGHDGKSPPLGCSAFPGKQARVF